MAAMASVTKFCLVTAYHLCVVISSAYHIMRLMHVRSENRSLKKEKWHEHIRTSSASALPFDGKRLHPVISHLLSAGLDRAIDWREGSIDGKNGCLHAQWDRQFLLGRKTTLFSVGSVTFESRQSICRETPIFPLLSHGNKVSVNVVGIYFFNPVVANLANAT